MKYGLQENLLLLAAMCFAMALRSIVSLYPYSGAGKPPMFGDYEAQRHWQEITLNLPASHWYRNTSDNDLLYWGLDYPPLTAYHSMALGKIASMINPSYVQLHKSRGFESEDHKFFMRNTVLLADILVYIPATLIAVLSVRQLSKQSRDLNSTLMTVSHLAVCLNFAGQMLIDNGHFQYNNISLGLAAFSFAAILYDRPVLASAGFILALNYKQMELYHALPIFIYLLRNCLKEKLSVCLGKLLTISSIVIFTSLLLWWPWIHSISSMREVVKRIFPLGRGVFEDKVSNIWCVVNIIVKLKQRFQNQEMALICLSTTLSASLPSGVHLFQKPTKLNFLYSLFNISMCFFLFSFQVHEKSILLPALPAMLLFPFHPFFVVWFLQVATCSMFPLFFKDDLTLPFIATWLMFYSMVEMMCSLGLMQKDPIFRNFKFLYTLSNAVSLVLVVCHIFAPFPKHLPHIYSLAISVYCCLHFVLFLIYGIAKQFSL